MVDGPELPGGWGAPGQHEPSADLLRRAIQHVEQLLERLEYTPLSTGAEAPAEVTEAPEDESQPTPQEEPEAATPEQAEIVVHSSSQAEALRITLSAHEEANRLRAEAGAMRAEAAAEGERMLTEAQELAERVQVEARQDADRAVADAQRDADHQVAEARKSAEVVRAAAETDAVRIRAEAEADAEGIRRDVEQWTLDQRQAAETMIQEALDAATRDAEEIRTRAHQVGRAEADRQVEIAVRSAVAQARSEVELTRARAQEVLVGAADNITNARDAMQAIINVMGSAMASLSATAGAVDNLIAVAADTTAGPEERGPRASHEEPAGAVVAEVAEVAETDDAEVSAAGDIATGEHIATDESAGSGTERDVPEQTEQPEQPEQSGQVAEDADQDSAPPAGADGDGTVEPGADTARGEPVEAEAATEAGRTAETDVGGTAQTATEGEAATETETAAETAAEPATEAGGTAETGTDVQAATEPTPAEQSEPAEESEQPEPAEPAEQSETAGPEDGAEADDSGIDDLLEAEQAPPVAPPEQPPARGADVPHRRPLGSLFGASRR